MPDYLAYQKSISNELCAVKNRVRHFIGSKHWGEDGRYKEIILMDVLKRFLPANVEIGTGFVICDESDEVSSQIDIIIYKSSLPTLFKKDGFVIVPSSCVLGIIEVKTTLSNQVAVEAIKKAHENGKIIGSHIFNGIFGFGSPDSFRVRPGLSQTLVGHSGYVNHIAFGKDIFMKFWPSWQQDNSNRAAKYSFYRIKDLSFGYFVANLVENIVNMDLDLDLSPTLKKYFYPIEETKEAHRFDVIEITR